MLLLQILSSNDHFSSISQTNFYIKKCFVQFEKGDLEPNNLKFLKCEFEIGETCQNIKKISRALAAEVMFFGGSLLLQQGEERFSAPKKGVEKECALALGAIGGVCAAAMTEAGVGR